MNYTREKLIEICEKAFVPQDKWYNRDSAISQIRLGQAYALLKAGCEFEIQTKENNPDGDCVTDERTIWIQFYVHDFSWFEYAGEDERGYTGDYHFYLPTEKRLQDRKGEDWY